MTILSSLYTARTTPIPFYGTKLSLENVNIMRPHRRLMESQTGLQAINSVVSSVLIEFPTLLVT